MIRLGDSSGEQVMSVASTLFVVVMLASFRSLFLSNNESNILADRKQRSLLMEK